MIYNNCFNVQLVLWQVIVFYCAVINFLFMQDTNLHIQVFEELQLNTSYDSIECYKPLHASDRQQEH